MLLRIFLTAALFAATASAGNFTLLPMPQQVHLSDQMVHVGQKWRIELDASVPADDVAVKTLQEEFQYRHHLALRITSSADGRKIVLRIKQGAVAIGHAQDRIADALAAQAYEITIAEKEIHITANDKPGLFYGVETLAQLATKSEGGAAILTGQITDWPDLERRHLYWDDAHHLERPDALKRAIRQAAFFKINGFVIKLEGHFQYKSAPALVEPYAYSPAEFQDLTDYAAYYHVKLIPYLDSPAHIAFILKHPEYAGLRAFPDSNYELSILNPDSYKLLSGMFQDLLDANKGCDYFYLSTDEPYYVGMSKDGPFSSARLKELRSPGKLLADFLAKTAGYLHDHGRTVVFWGEHPMKPADVSAMNNYLVNGETDNSEFDAACKARGIRQMIYTSTEGEEKLFPDYVFAAPDHRLHQRDGGKPRVAVAIATINAPGARKNADLMGMLVAGWGDMGLHPETFWLGYATIASAGWNPTTDPARATSDFYRLFYGPSAHDMDRIYTLLSTQAQFWSDSWEDAQSTARKGIWGNSNSIFQPRHPAHDQTLSLPSIPDGDDLAAKGNRSRENARRLELAAAYLAENDELLTLLESNRQTVEFNRYNLDVFLSIARLCRQNLQMLQSLGATDAQIAVAHKAAAEKQPAVAVAALDRAINLAGEIRSQRNRVLRETTQTWYESWYPRVEEANGRKFLHELDDVKDHLPDRTVGMEYLIYRELLLPLAQWADQMQAARNNYAAAHQLPANHEKFDWNDLN